MGNFLRDWQKVGGGALVTLSVMMLIVQTAVPQTTPVSGASPTRKHDLWLFDPTPKDWNAIHDKEAITILEIYDLPEDGYQVDDQSIEILSQFKNLKTLVIGCEQLTDAAVPHLRKLKHLEALAIFNGKFSDKGVEKLNELPAIQTIGFFNTKVTEYGITQLQKAIPEAHIELGKYNQQGKVFDANGCLRSQFYRKYLKKPSS